MKRYSEKTFNIPALKGLSPKQMEEHLKLYAGYVKHVNLITEKIEELEKDSEKNAYIISELKRRFSFEFDGMRLHEYYFHSVEEGGKELDKDSSLYKTLSEQYNSFDNFISECVKISGTRGIGWTILYFDKEAGQFIMRWIDEHQIGHLAGLRIILVVDVWEHAFMVDYLPSEKKKYIESYLSNINWEIVEKNFRD